MTDKQHGNLIMSAILPSTLCFLAACLGILVVFTAGISSKTMNMFFTIVFGIAGYCGLIRLHYNRFKIKVVSNFICLICGFVSYLLIFYWIELSFEDVFKLPQSIPGFLFLISLIWIFLVYVFLYLFAWREDFC